MGWSDKTTPVIVQLHQSSLMVDDADSEILLDADKKTMRNEELAQYIELVRLSGISLLDLYENVRLKDWVDSDRIRKTFYGDTPKTIREIFSHIDSVQMYYLSRISSFSSSPSLGFLERREYCLETIRSIFVKDNNERVVYVDNEHWTVKKVLRRFLWHDRIHAKSMVRILEKQQKESLIDSYHDPFSFFR